MLDILEVPETKIWSLPSGSSLGIQNDWGYNTNRKEVNNKRWCVARIIQMVHHVLYGVSLESGGSPSTSASSGSLFEIHILGLYLRPTEYEVPWMGPKGLHFNKMLR